MTTRAALVAHARDSIAKGSKSFAMASRLFDPVTRERAWLLYAWCRRCDDIADGQEHGGALSDVEDPHAKIAEIRARTDAALSGTATGDPAFDGLGLVAAECTIPPTLIHDLIEGFALDAAGWRPTTTDDLMRYCYHVAGSVGCMMALVMGISPDDEIVLDRACDLGLAFQLANIARDIREDATGGRCYIPAMWLDEVDLTEQTLLDSDRREALGKIGRRLAMMAADYEASARLGASALPFRCAWAVLAAAGIYGDIAREVRRRGPNAWDRRIVTSKAAKLGWVIRAGGNAAMRPGIESARAPRPPASWSRDRF
jgi:phytoene synthase